MKSALSLADQPMGLPLLADDIIEFHAARLLLLFRLCGKKDRIDGLTKMAKLDFFVRYPQFFADACQHQGTDASSRIRARQVTDTVESGMVRYHYGPWDQRYYQVLAYMKARELLDISQAGQGYKLSLTPLGHAAADELIADAAFKDLVTQMHDVKAVFGNVTGSNLKKLIYRLFDEEVGQRAKGEVITHGN